MSSLCVSVFPLSATLPVSCLTVGFQESVLALMFIVAMTGNLLSKKAQ